MKESLPPSSLPSSLSHLCLSLSLLLHMHETENSFQWFLELENRNQYLLRNKFSIYTLNRLVLLTWLPFFIATEFFCSQDFNLPGPLSVEWNLHDSIGNQSDSKKGMVKQEFFNSGSKLLELWVVLESSNLASGFWVLMISWIFIFINYKKSREKTGLEKVLDILNMYLV